MSDDYAKLESIEDKLVNYLSARSRGSNFVKLKVVIINLAVSACHDQELFDSLIQAQKLIQKCDSFKSIGGYPVARARKDVDFAIRYFGVDSKEAWLARINYCSLHNREEDDDVLLTLIFEFCASNEVSAEALCNLLSNQFLDLQI